MKPEFWPRVLVCADVVPVSCHVFGAWRTRYSVVGLLPPPYDWYKLDEEKDKGRFIDKVNRHAWSLTLT